MYPYITNAIKIEQPLGVFFILSLPVSLLLDTCHSIKTEILDEVEDINVHSIGSLIDRIKGTQRATKLTRLEEIKRYSETVDACFPNAIILGANYDETGMLVSDEKLRWEVEESDNGVYLLTIPSNVKLASIIDGQHRVFGFKNSKAKDMHLLCSVFIDLPMPYHAQLFTKINTTQKRVDKNLAYNLFQFDMEQGDSDTWSPEILAVYFARVLSSNEDSPFNNIIRLGISGKNIQSSISMASVIDRILSLITSNAEKDRSVLHSRSLNDGRSRDLLTELKSNAPLRSLYIKNKDKTLYDIIFLFFKAIEEVLWENRDDSTIFKKTLGVQASFDFLKIILESYGDEYTYTKDFFIGFIEGMRKVDFNNEFYGVQSKLRSRIKNTFLVVSGLKEVEALRCSGEDKKYYLEVQSKLN